MKMNANTHVGKDFGRETIGEETVRLVLDFQTTGGGFEGVWNHVGPTVERMVRGLFLKRGVRGPFGRADEDAVQEATQQVSVQSIVKSAVAKFDPSTDPGDREFRQIMNRLAHDAVESLDDDLRTLFRLNRWEGLSERQIADRLPIHVSSVHRRLKRAEKLVGRYLEDRGFDTRWLAEAFVPEAADFRATRNPVFPITTVTR